MPATIKNTKSHTRKSLFKTSEVNPGSTRAMHIPAANVDESEVEYIITIAAAGFCKEDFAVDIKDAALVVSATKEITSASFKHDRCEYDFSNWKRVFALPADADALMARANYKNGELSIRIPKGSNDSSIFTHSIYVY